MQENEVKQKTMTIPNVFQRVHAIMTDLSYIQKGDSKVNGQYTFASHDDVSAKVHPLLVKHRVLAVPSVERATQEHNRTNIDLSVTFINIDNPSDNFAVKYPGYGIDTGDKGPGKAISYAFKYALLKTLCLQTGDDPDNTANSVYEPPKCLEFDSLMAPLNLSDKEKMKMKRFLTFCSQAMNKHVEEIKKEAVQRPEDFIRRFQVWEPEKKG